MTDKHPVPRFEYQPLDLDQPTAIRILILSGGSGNSPIESSILHTDLKDPSSTIKYEALSYEWKEASNDDPIILVNNCEFRIRKNLYDALIQLRFVDKDRFLWIDALCINQSNHLERNRQVRIMQTIYKRAKRVILWLGPAKDDSDLALEILEIIETTRGEKDKFQNLRTELVSLGAQHSLPCVKDHTGTEDHGDDWNDTVKETLAIRHITTLRYWAQRGWRFRLGQCMDICLDSLIATEPRDFVYGMRGLVSDCGRDELVPDYQKSLKDVFFDAVPILKRSSNSSAQVISKLAKKLDLTEDEDVQLCLLEMKDHNNEPEKVHRTTQIEYPGE
ncbi:ankyrin repeat and sam domain containing protein 6 [Botrytis cinerea]